MRRLMLLLATACILITQGAAEPANPGPWDVSTVSKSDSHRHAKLETGDTPGPLKYLHLEVNFAPNATERKLHNFRVVDSKGKTVGEYFGGDSKKSQLVFERETPWASLNGLYLDGQGRRVPLFATQPVRPAPTTLVQPTVVQPRPVPPTTLVEPRGVYVPPSTVTTVPGVRSTYTRPAETILVEPRDRVVAGVERDVVVHEHHGDTRRIVEHHHTGVGGGGGHGHGGGGGHGTGGGSGGGGCPYGDACPVCGTGAEEGAGALDPWAFDEMGQGRYDDLLARIENSGFAPNLGAPSMGSGSGGGAGSGIGGGSAGGGAGGGFGPAGATGLGSTAGMGSGLGNGQGGGPLPGMASTGSGSGRSPGVGPGSGGPGAGPGAGGPGPGAGPGAGGPGQGPGMGQGEGPGPGEGQGPGSGEGQGPGPGEAPEASPEERFGTPGSGGPGSGGPGPGAMAGPMEGAPSEMMPNEPIPGENNPMNMSNPMMNAMANNGSGGGGGAGGSIGPQNLFGPRVINPLAPRVNFHNLAPEPDLPEFNRPEIDVYGYRPTIVDPRYRFDPRYRYDPQMGQFGYGGGGGGGGIGNGMGGRYDNLAKTGLPVMPELPEMMGEIVLYISAGNDGEQGGTIYQVNDTGRVLGKIKLPYQATGLAIHRDDGLIAVTPRDRGKIYRVDDKGELSVIMEGNSRLPHPVDVGVAGDSDMILVADSSEDVLAATDITGREPIVYQRFETAQYDQQKMSVAVTRDKHVMYGTDAQNGIYRFGRDKDTASHAPMLPGSGGVAADPKSLKWAATQSPNLIHLYEGEMPLKTLKLGPGRSIYRQGLLSFAPSGAVVVATRPSDEVDRDVRLLAYETAEGKEGQVFSLFDWDSERMLDFVVGPRMIWEGHQPSTYKSKY